MLLNGLLDYSFRERSVGATREKQLVKEIFGGWECVRSWWDGPSATPETKTATVLLLSKLLQVCAPGICLQPLREPDSVHSGFTLSSPDRLVCLLGHQPLGLRAGLLHLHQLVG